MFEVEPDDGVMDIDEGNGVVEQAVSMEPLEVLRRLREEYESQLIVPDVPESRLLRQGSVRQESVSLSVVKDDERVLGEGRFILDKDAVETGDEVEGDWMYAKRRKAEMGRERKKRRLEKGKGKE